LVTSSVHDPEALRRRAAEVAQNSVSAGSKSDKILSPEEMQKVLYELRLYQIELEMQSEELRQAQLDLYSERERYFNLYDLAPVGYCTASVKGLILEANLTAASLLGGSRQQLLNQRFNHFIAPQHQDSYYLQHNELLASRQTRSFDLQMVGGQAQPFWAKLIISLVQRDDGDEIRIVLSDITERMHAELAVRESEERYRTVFQISPDAVNINRLSDGLYIDINDGFTRLTGWTREDILGRSSLDIGIWHDQSTRQKLVEALHRDGFCQELEADFVVKNGQIKTAQMSARIITIDDVPCILSITRDITQRNHAEAELRESECALNEAQALAQIGSYVTNLTTGIWQASPTLQQILGIDSSVVSGVENWAKFMAPGFQQKLADYHQSVVEGDGNFDMEYEVIRLKDGQRRWVHALGRFVYDAKGKPIFHKGTIQDITERKLRDARLLENMADIRLREQALSQISQGVLISGADRLTTYVNDEFVRITGYSREEMLGKPCGILQGADTSPEVVSQIRAALDAGQSFHGEILNYRKDGTPFWNELSINSVFDETGAVTQFVGVLRDVTQRKKTLEDLNIFRKCVNNANDVIVITEAEPLELPGPHILFVNDAYERITGYAREEAIGGTPRMLQGQKTDSAAIKRMGQALRKWQPVREEVLNYTKDGREFWSEIDIVPIANEAGWYTHWISIQRDISERKSAEEAQRIASIAFETEQGMFITDAHTAILRVNKAFTKITGYTANEAIGQTPALLNSGQHDANFYASMWDSISRTGAWQGEIWNRHKNGKVYPEHLSISTVKNDAGVLTHYVGAFSDLTSYKAAEEQINDLAYTDLLTGLPNRRLLIVRLQQAIMTAESQQHQGALLLVDLDHFKNLNDSLGHALGDEVLQRFAKRMRASVRDCDTVARFGGDKFAVLLDRLSPDPQTALRQAETVANKMREALKRPYQLAKSQVSCTASMGLAFFGQQDEDTLEPFKRAELAMYQAKAGGRDALRFFDPQMQAAVNARVTLEAALRTALDEKQFVLYYQAQISDSEGIIGAEALLRWFDPKRGLVSPAEFIPLAEETGLILPIGSWVLEAACQQLVLWSGQPELEHLSIAVNVSTQQFRESNFVAQVLATLERTGANAKRLKLELTESVLIADAEDVIIKMNTLKAIGIGFAIDDFGTGYSSLSYIKRLPLDRLKIDQSFVRDILMDADDAAISRAIIAMATSTGIGVIAEGVETEAQREFLASLGCHTYQGYLFSRPVPIDEFEAFAK
jgi:diguanylate cyclase (GGDEF)-like protein/PAS domain S-box-containing protein